MFIRLSRLLLPGLLLACLTACGTPLSKLLPHQEPSWTPQKGLLKPCLDVQDPVAGDTDGTLAQGFLDGRAGLRLCRGIVQSVYDQIPDTPGKP